MVSLKIAESRPDGRNEPVCLTDLFSTVAADLQPILEGRKLAKPLREAVTHRSAEDKFSVRQGPWKLVVGRGSGRSLRTGNLYQKRPEVVRRLKDYLKRTRRKATALIAKLSSSFSFPRWH